MDFLRWKDSTHVIARIKATKTNKKWSRNDESKKNHRGENEEREEHTMNSQIDFSVELRRTHGGFETSFPQRFMVLILIGELVDLSLTQAYRERNPKGEK
jgi:hypothetical protein